MSTSKDWIQQQFPDIDTLTQLDQGGQKTVFYGRHVRDGDIVLKIFRPGADEERVLREIRAAQNVPSPRVPRIFDAGIRQTPMGDFIWIREQRIPGQNLREVIALTKLEDQQILRLALHVLEALDAAESVHIVHRDVKPANIIAANNGAYWLIDFGLARHLDLESITQTAWPFGVGTPGYAPPEQFRNRKIDIDARADLFGLGVTLYECSEGMNPYRFGARDQIEINKRVEQIQLPYITRQIGVGDKFRDLVYAMTRKQADYRPQNTAEALSWIKEICNEAGMSDNHW